MSAPISAEQLGDVAQVSAGIGHTCVVSFKGDVRCWGRNREGQVGDGTLTLRNAPGDPIATDGGAVAVSAGGFHTCVVTILRRVKCWGWNRYGQVGNGGTSEAVATPADVVAAGDGIKAISAGLDHTCAITVTSTLKCWGNNEFGQLGDGGLGRRVVAIDVIGLRDVVSVSAGAGHTCAATAQGGAYCWGYNQFGQLGSGTRSGTSIPVAVTGLQSGVRAVGVGEDHSCALMTTGAVKCWGANRSGQIGDGTTTDRVTPVDVPGIDASELVAGIGHTCVLVTNGIPRCWGLNAFGVLGNAEFTGFVSSKPLDVTASGFLRLVSVTTGYTHSCGITYSRYLMCWGSNIEGQLGSASGTSVDLPTDAPAGLLASPFTTVAVGPTHTCVSHGGLICWGSNAHGERGVGTLRPGQHDLPPLGLSTPLRAITAGDGFTCFIQASRSVGCAGNNGSGQLGDGTTIDRASPVFLSIGGAVSAISAGNAHVCVLIANRNSVKCWGANASGQLGDGTTTARTMAVDVVGLQGGVAAIAAGSEHTCAVMLDGAVRCWGGNANSQIGDAAFVNVLMPKQVLASGAKAIAAGRSHTCVLLTSGAVRCWGDNRQGQIGNPDVAPITAGIVAGLGNDVASLSTGGDRTCALTFAGRVKCWGGNLYGNVTGFLIRRIYAPQREARDVIGLTETLSSIAVGANHICGITAKARALCWGDNTDGQIGNDLAGVARVAVVVVLALPPVVVEFYNATLDSYFNTAEAGEAFAIDNQSAGRGWTRTGESFNAGGTMPVCRFYGSASPGPNTHLYTIDPFECGTLRSREFAANDPRRLTVPNWHFESFAFLSTPPLNDGRCLSTLVPVFRAYNNGVVRGLETRHRLTTSAFAIGDLVAHGWLNEGTVMCAPR